MWEGCVKGKRHWHSARRQTASIITALNGSALSPLLSSYLCSPCTYTTYISAPAFLLFSLALSISPIRFIDRQHVHRKPLHVLFHLQWTSDVENPCTASPHYTLHLSPAHAGCTPPPHHFARSHSVAQL